MPTHKTRVSHKYCDIPRKQGHQVHTEIQEVSAQLLKFKYLWLLLEKFKKSETHIRHRHQR